MTGNIAGQVSVVGHVSTEHYYSFTAFVPGIYQFNSCQSQFDTVLYVYDRDLNDAIASCDDQHDCASSCGYQAVLELELPAGDFVVVVEGFHGEG